MTMTDTTTAQGTLTLATVKIGAAMPPNYQDCWKSENADDRTFFVVANPDGTPYDQGGQYALVVNRDDPRGEGMWDFTGSYSGNPVFAEALPHVGWWFNTDQFEEPEGEIAVGDRVKIVGYSVEWDGPATVEMLSTEPNLIHVRSDHRQTVGAFEPRHIFPLGEEKKKYDLTDREVRKGLPMSSAYPMGSVWNHRTYGDMPVTIVGYKEREGDVLVNTPGRGEACPPSLSSPWPRGALDEYGTLVRYAIGTEPEPAQVPETEKVPTYRVTTAQPSHDLRAGTIVTLRPDNGKVESSRLVNAYDAETGERIGHGGFFRHRFTPVDEVVENPMYRVIDPDDDQGATDGLLVTLVPVVGNPELVIATDVKTGEVINDGGGLFAHRFALVGEEDPKEPTIPFEVLAFTEGQRLDGDQIKDIRGVMFTRRGASGLWITHGDGTASKIDGPPGTRGASHLGLGQHMPGTDDPGNCWVRDGWAYAGYDPSQVPVKEERVESQASKVIMNGDRPATQEDFDGMRRELADAHAVVDRKSRDIESLHSQVSSVRANHEADIQRIGDRLLEECEARDWCSEYDQVVEDLNRNLTVELPVREHEYDVTLRVIFTRTVTVRANDEDAAADAAHDQFEVRDLMDDEPDEVENYRITRS